MHRGYFKWLVGAVVACILVIALFMWYHQPKEIGPQHHPVPQPYAPFKSYISAVGIVEASSGNIFIGSPVNRVVDQVEVVVGQKVKAGDILFRLEAADLKADLEARCIDYENALANLAKLEALPRAEDIAAAQAQHLMASVALNQAKSQYQRVEGLQSGGAVSQEEVSRRRFALSAAEAKFQQTEADLKKTTTGTWQPDKEIARLQVKQAEAQVQRVEADIERTLIRAPIDATVLQIKIHPGEFPPSDSSQTPPMIIGNIDSLHLRVSINQFDASYYDQYAPAVAHLQGNASIDFPLTFLHLEPFFVSKQVLNNDITEKVDTRVLQAIYGFEEGEKRVFVGQQMDVFIKTQFMPTEQKHEE